MDLAEWRARVTLTNALCVVARLCALSAPLLLTGSAGAAGYDASDPSGPFEGVGKLDFYSEFNSPAEITGPEGKGPWFTMEDNYKYFGYSKFMSATFPGVYKVKGGFLSINQRVDRSGEWRSGLIMSINRSGAGKEYRGFTAKYGYWEARMRFPKGEMPGAWPAFWLVGQRRVDKSYAEIDIVEIYSGNGDPSAYYVNTHRWPAFNAPHGPHASYGGGRIKANERLFDGRWHTYGVKLVPGVSGARSSPSATAIYYFDGHEKFRSRVKWSADDDKYIVISLALWGREQIKLDPSWKSPMHMDVDYVRHFPLSAK